MTWAIKMIFVPMHLMWADELLLAKRGSMTWVLKMHCNQDTGICAKASYSCGYNLRSVVTAAFSILIASYMVGSLRIWSAHTRSFITPSYLLWLRLTMSQMSLLCHRPLIVPLLSTSAAPVAVRWQGHLFLSGWKKRGNTSYNQNEHVFVKEGFWSCTISRDSNHVQLYRLWLMS